MAGTFATAVAAKDAQILALEAKLVASEAAIQEANRDGSTPEARNRLLEVHFQQGIELKESRDELRALNIMHGESMTALQASLDASDRTAARSAT
eukprot:gene12315-15481_t